MRDVTLAMLAARRGDATVCPSEVARAMAGAGGPEERDGDWRAMMPMVHEAIDGLVNDGRVQLSWKRQPLTARAGPYRIGRGPRW